MALQINQGSSAFYTWNIKMGFTYVKGLYGRVLDAYQYM